MTDATVEDPMKLRPRWSCPSLLPAILLAIIFNTSAMAADRYFAKQRAGKIATRLAGVLPNAPAGWKVISTKSAATPPTPLPGQKLRKGYTAAASRQYRLVGGNRKLSLTIVFGIKPDLDSQDARYRASVSRWPTAENRMLNGRPVYFLPTATALTYYMRAGSFAIFGKTDDKGWDKSLILALLGKVDSAKLKILADRHGK